jgi:hypothetical protein
MNQVSQRLWTKSFSASAVLGAALLLCLTVMLAAAPAAFSAPSRASYIVVLKDDVAHPANVAHRHEDNRGAEVGHIYGVAIKGYSADLTPGELKAIKQDPNVDYVERDAPIHPDSQVTPNQVKRVYANQNPQLDIDGVDDARVDVDIAILDTGVAEHPDLNIAGRTDCVGKSGGCADGGGTDVDGHGTHVAGDAAAVDNGIGVVGTAPGARIWSVKVISGNTEGITGSQMSDAIAGINWVTAHSNVIEVANMSFDCSTKEKKDCAKSSLTAAIAASVNSGVVWVAAAGDESADVDAEEKEQKGKTYPAVLPDVIAVSGMVDYDGLPGTLGKSESCILQHDPGEFDMDDRLMVNSNVGSAIDMTAPGVCIYSTWLDGSYALLSGTSMSSALVAGAAADIAAQYNPSNRQDVEKIKAELLWAGNYGWMDKDWLGVPSDNVQEPLLDLHTTPFIPGAPGPPPPPPAPQPPTVSLLSFTGITQDLATLNGAYNMNGPDGRYWFQCVSEGGHRFETPETYVPAGSGSVSVEYALSGLEWGMTYHCRMTANNEGGYTNGPDQIFTTKPGPVAEALAPSEVTKSKIVMAGRVDPKGGAVSYHFEYGTLAGYGNQTEEKSLPVGSGFQAVSAPVEGLPTGWPLHYRVVVKLNSRTAASADQMATTGWSLESSSGPSEAKFDTFLDVSCAAAASCVSVGQYVDKTGKTLVAAQKWNGSTWSLATPTAPTGLWSALKGVTCTTTTSCMAVGTLQETGGAYRPLAMQWNGSTWSQTAAPAGPGGYNSYFNDVACTAANSCDAVGYSVPSSGAEIIKPLVSHWNGSAWAIKTSANPTTPGGEPSQEDNRLESVSCASPTVCMAVGHHYSSIGGVQVYQPLIERLSGEEWINQETDTATAKNSGQTDIWLFGVSCPTTSFCAAVGFSAAQHTVEEGRRPFAQRWDGSKWTYSSTPLENNSPTQLFGISCTSPVGCRAVGPGPGSMHWTGPDNGWKPEAPPSPANNNWPQPPRLNSISCPTVAECHAVGSYKNTSEYTGRYTPAWSGAGVAPVADPGSPATPAPSNRTETSITLQGMVDAGGVDTKYYFEYGPTEAYGSKTAEANAGSWAVGLNNWFNGWYQVTANLSGLEPGIKYHYRVVATNGFSTVKGPDHTFETKGNMAVLLNELPLTEAFSGTTTVVSDFATKWSKLGWLTGTNAKGVNNFSGWGPSEETPTGAYFAPIITDTGVGTAAVATSSNGVTVGGGFSLWLDMPTPATTKTGYELRFQATATNVYTVTLKKWVAGAETVLATKTGFAFGIGSSLALADKGGTVQAWTNTGTGFSKILSAADSAYAAGNAGVEARGMSTRLTKFKAGLLQEKGTVDTALSEVPVTDPFSKIDAPLSGGGAWAALSWAKGTTFKTGWVEPKGWGVAETLNGAYWQKATVGDSGGGDTAMITLGVAPGVTRYFSLWLNAPNPGTLKSGYELRMTETAFNTYEAKITKWVSGTATALVTKTGVGLSPGAKVALTDKLGVVAAYTGGPPFTQIAKANDSTYSYGYGGIEAQAGAELRLREFKIGPLAPY